MSQFWRRYGIDMLKEAISLPGLAFKFEMLFSMKQSLRFTSPVFTQDLYQLFKDNMVGGPAIIFHRHAEKDKAKIHETQYREAAKLVQKSSATTPMPYTFFGFESTHDHGTVHHLESL